MLVSLWHAVPQFIILVIACLVTGWWGDGPLWVPDAVGMGAALLGLMLMMVYGTAFGLMFSCVNVIFRDFQRIVQTFINMVPFTAPMMYPFHIVADGTRIPSSWLSVYLANPVAEAVMLTVVSGYLGLVAGVAALEAWEAILPKLGSDLPFGPPNVGLGIAASAGAVLVVFGALAGVIPSYHASKVAPVEALRTE